MRIELLHFEGCPGSTEVLGILENVVVQEGFPAEILPVVPDPDHWSDFPGSPTILVNGEDLFPVERHSIRATSCRIYATPEGPKNHPTATMVREALVKRSSDESSADHRQFSPRP
ncbi:MAG: hypothetical protein M3N45_04690 [Actinomycetota bacterium]|nr:hypothetical protein [Actinomycetota bacterium]